MERVNQASPNSVPGLASLGSGHDADDHHTKLLFQDTFTTNFELSIIVLLIVVVSTALLHSLLISFSQSVVQSFSDSVTPSLTFSLPSQTREWKSERKFVQSDLGWVGGGLWRKVFHPCIIDLSIDHPTSRLFHPQLCQPYA